MATFCGGIKLDESLEVIDGIITKTDGTPTDESVVSVCGQLWDGEIFGKAIKNGAEVVTIVTPTIQTPLSTVKANCGIKLDSRYFNVESESVEFAMRYFLSVYTTPPDATVEVKQGDTTIEKINGINLYPMKLVGEKYTVTVSAEDYVTQSVEVTAVEDKILEIDLEEVVP